MLLADTQKDKYTNQATSIVEIQTELDSACFMTILGYDQLQTAREEFW